LKANNGDLIVVDYIGRLDNQVIFDSTEIRGPMEFEIGRGDLIPKFEEAFVGMDIGEKKTIEIGFLDAYGDYSDDLTFEVEKNKFPDGMALEVGMPLQFEEETGQIAVFKVKDIKEESVTIDANHPLAGKDLTFEITLVNIKNRNKILI